MDSENHNLSPTQFRLATRTDDAGNVKPYGENLIGKKVRETWESLPNEHRITANALVSKGMAPGKAIAQVHKESRKKG